MNTSKLETNTQTIERLTRERDAALAACAEWRSLSQHICCWNEECHTGGEACDVCKAVAHALSLDCGKDWLSPEKKKALIEALTLLYEETASYITINHLGDVHHNMSMQKAREALVKEEK